MPLAVPELLKTGSDNLTILKLPLAVPVPITFVALKITAVEAVTVGVPVITPVSGLKLNPGGNELTPKPLGALLAVSV